MTAGHFTNRPHPEWAFLHYLLDAQYKNRWGQF